MHFSISGSTAAEPFFILVTLCGESCVDEDMLPLQIQAITSKRRGGDDLCMTDAAFLAVSAGERAAPHI